VHSYALALLQVAEMFLHGRNGSFARAETIGLPISAARRTPTLNAAAMKRPYLDDINLCHAFPCHQVPHVIPPFPPGKVRGVGVSEHMPVYPNGD
jgi:hypothetical protein